MERRLLVVAIVIVGYSLYPLGAFAIASVHDGSTNAAAVGPDRLAGIDPHDLDTSNLSFADISAERGFVYHYTPDLGLMSDAGVYVTDFDRDGWPDILAVGGDDPVLFANDEGTFEESDALPSLDVPVRAAIFFDADGDGWEDLLLLPTFDEAVFLKNEQGTFEVTSVGLEVPLDVPTGGTVGDYDGDGCLDVFVTQNGDWTGTRPRGTHNYSVPDGTDNGGQNLLFDGDCSGFTNVTAEAGIAGTRWSLASSFADFDGDGALDIHVANDFNHDLVYRNQGDGTFRAVRLGSATNRNGMSSEVADVNADGAPDVFTTNIYFPPEVNERVNLTTDFRAKGNNLLENRGDGTFEESADEYGVRLGGWGWAATIADLDNDADQDLVHATSEVSFYYADERFSQAEIDRLYYRYPAYRYTFVAERVGDSFATTNASAAGFEPTNGRAIARLDFDRDGALDLVIATAGGHYRLYRNTADVGTSVQVRPLGGEGTTALGAQVVVETDDGTQVRHVQANTDYLSQESRTVHIGLGVATVVDVAVVWPDGRRVELPGTATGQHLVVAPNGTVSSRSHASG